MIEKVFTFAASTSSTPAACAVKGAPKAIVVPVTLNGLTLTVTGKINGVATTLFTKVLATGVNDLSFAEQQKFCSEEITLTLGASATGTAVLVFD